MTAIVLPDIDRSTIEELKKRIPDLSEIELPSLPTRKEVRRTADQTIDRLLGRKRAPVWPWIAAGIGLVALVGVIAAWFAWFRRPTWETPQEDWGERAVSTETPGTSEAWPASAAVIDDIETSSMETTPAVGASRAASSRAASAATKPAAASRRASLEDSPLGSAPYEEA